MMIKSCICYHHTLYIDRRYMSIQNFFQSTHLKPITYEPYNRKLQVWLSLLPTEHQSIVFIYTTPNYSIVILRRHLITTQSDTAVTINSYIKAIMAAQVANSSLFLTISPEKMKSCDVTARTPDNKKKKSTVYELLLAITKDYLESIK